MADFGVAHESVGEADCASRGVEGGVGAIGPDAVHCRGSGKGHGVVIPARVYSPAVEDDECDKALVGHGSEK